jgi:3'-5' exonuclease
MTTIYFDIETIGTSDPAVIAEGIKPPGNMSKAETIAKWEAENKQQAIDDAVAKTGLDGGLGSIICISWAVNDEGVVFANAGDERTIIKKFLDDVQEAAALHYSGGVVDNPPLFVGHNITSFDLRFLWQRCVVLGIKPPNCLPIERWQQSKAIADTMLMWNPDREKRISLDNLCKRLSVESPKSIMTGADVWGFFKAGRIDEITRYCCADVEATRQCYKRMMFSV